MKPIVIAAAALVLGAKTGPSIDANGTTSNGATSNGATSNGATSNGTSLNGISFNLASLNGISVNGISVNGISVNGISVNGISLNRIAVNGISVNGISLNGLRLNGSALTTKTSKNQLLTGSQLLGAEFTGKLYDGDVPVKLRIDGVDVEKSKYPQDNIYHYRISYVRADDSSNTRGYVCGKRENNDVRRAIPIQGRWDYREGVPTGGSHIMDENTMTFACEDYALYKCVELGYKPWHTKAYGDMTAYHEACTRLIRADYCGDGRSWTVNGTLINVFDHLGIQKDTQNWPTEAEWDKDGARCLSHQRIQNLQTGPQCSFEKSPIQCGKNVDWSKTLLMSEAR